MKADRPTIRTYRARLVLGAIAGLAALGLATVFLRDDGPPVDNSPRTTIALAVLGDSSSHSYQDSLSFPPGSGSRGGAFHARTFQWTEVLTRLRGEELNLGPWVLWGRSGELAWLRGLLGLHAGRAPRKEDYLYNFANSGATCQNLIGGPLQRYPQAPRLVELMDRDPARWRNGVVVIRIGSNDWSTELDEQARDPKAPAIRAVATYCLDQIAATVSLIHAAHPDTRIVLVGIDNELNDPRTLETYRSALAVANIQASFDDFNGQMRAFAGSDARMAFFDLGAWSRSLWGSRGPDGAMEARTVTVGTLHVTNTVGDAPNNAILVDDHSGLAGNALWAQALVSRLREAFGLPLTPISDAEVARFVSPP